MKNYIKALIVGCLAPVALSAPALLSAPQWPLTGQAPAPSLGTHGVDQSEPITPMTPADLSELTDVLRDCGNEEAADEIDAANSGHTVNFVSYASTPAGRHGLTSADGRTVGIDRNVPNGVAGKAAVLLHEWTHAQNVGGKNGTPTTPDEERDPCNHLVTKEKGLELMCRLRCQAELDQAAGVEPDPPFTAGDQTQLEGGIASASRNHYDCERGQTPPYVRKLWELGHSGPEPYEPPCDPDGPCEPGDGCQ